MKNWRVLFCIYAVGSVGYSLIEVLWRGYTHWTMGVAGGVCFQMLYAIEHRWSRAKQWIKCAAGALGITGVELAFGLVLNRKLGLGIWDYSCGRAMCSARSVRCLPDCGFCSAGRRSSSAAWWESF